MHVDVQLFQDHLLKRLSLLRYNAFVSFKDQLTELNESIPGLSVRYIGNFFAYDRKIKRLTTSHINKETVPFAIVQRIRESFAKGGI